MGCGQGCYPASVYPAQWMPYNTGMLLAEPHPRENTECLSYSHTEHVAECCCAECHPWPGWASWELQGMFGSRWGSPSSYLAAGHPWNPSAFPWSCGFTSVSPGATSCTPNLAREHFGFLLHSTQVSCQSPLSMHRFPSPCWPCAACPAGFWALPPPACPTPGRVCVLQEKQDVPCQHSALLKSHCSAASLAALPPNYPFSIGFYNRNLYARPRSAVPLYLWGFMWKGANRAIGIAGRELAYPQVL